ncbi:response regulator [Flavobacterium rakeshii]|uniref:Response regulator n=1 Tax=Flavobacterium rakeshii TaxID=1038845 RepID=A0A6N8H8K6_9FLAO|nr:response regulator transcription factor [Flavobacterium rakeshii]MEE1898295.1 response regulator transcription factor [Flavobacterium rakeshii]MUV02851.1 response regulator [Flavobacterium rakeshii]
MSKIKIIIVDDHLLFSQSLSYLVGSFENFEVAGIYNNGKEFITAVKGGIKLPDIVLLDVNMPIMDGIETMKWIKQNHPDQKVIALSVNNDEDTVMRMITNGAKGYLLKDTDPKNFKEALEEVYSRGFYYSEMVSGYLINKLNNDNKIVLKEREIEFIKLACTEKTYKEIADGMCLSPKTIDGYRENLFHKLEIKTRIGLVLYAIKHKIVCI